MAKLKAPLFSLGASGQLGKALVFFPWKGLNLVREHVVPSNPRSTAQTTQRGYLTAAVDLIHSIQAHAGAPLVAADTVAYALWGSTYATPRTWFNQAVKHLMEQLKLGKSAVLLVGGTTTPGVDKLDLSISAQGLACTAGKFWYGTSKTALINSKPAGVAANVFTVSLTPLTTGVKYYWQLRLTAPAGCLGAKSGIYYGVPT